MIGYDAIVVGTGPGGATVAKELARRGAEVLVVERGGNEPIQGTATQAIRQVMMPGRSLLVTNGLLGVVRGLTTGGSSVFFYATAWDPPLQMLAAHGVHLADELVEAKAELPCAPLSDELVGPRARRIKTSARELGYAWDTLPKLVHQDRCKPDCDRCSMGCPKDAKWTAREFVDEARAHGATFLPRARVVRVLEEDGRAIGIETLTRHGRQLFYGDTVIVAAGGIGTPVILRATGIRRAGHDFFFDPLAVIMGSVADLDGGREFPMAAGVHMADEGYVMTDLALPAWLYRLLTAAAGHPGRVLAHRRTLPIMVKIKDDLGGRLTNRGGIRKGLTESDRRKLRDGTERARGILRNAGARRTFSTLLLASHPGGTAKIGDVVDSNLETEINNLYVCDCSVIPEAWGLPPSLTLIALGKRLGRHLGGERTH